MPITERELWACAQHVIETHGHLADAFVVERVTVLAAEKDLAGLRTWQAIAERMYRLRNVQPPSVLN